MQSVWPTLVVSPETLTQRVKILRRELGDDSDKPRYIESRRGHGYRLLSVLVPLSEQQVGGSRDREAQELYSQARTIMRGTHESRDKALLFLDQALARDPHFAEALAFGALLRAGAVMLSGALATLLERARQDASLALAEGGAIADAHIAQAMIFAHEHRWVEADADHRAAIALNEADVSARNMYVLNVLRPTGQLRRAGAELVASYRSAPADGFTAHELALTHVLLGDDAAATKFATLAQALSGLSDPHWDLMLVHARVAARRGNYSEAAECAERSLPPILHQAGSVEVVRAFYAALADSRRLAFALDALVAFAPRLGQVGVDGRTRGFFFSAVAMLGGLDAAFDLANQWMQRPDSTCITTDWSDLWLPELRAFRADPRFQDLVSRLGLVEYWARLAPADHFPPRQVLAS